MRRYSVFQRFLSVLFVVFLVAAYGLSAVSAAEPEFQIENGVLLSYSGPGGDIVIPEDVTDVRDRAFGRNPDITSITYPESIISVNGASGCINLSSVTIPEGALEIGLGAFEGCKSLQSIVIPDSVLRINSLAFRHCSALTSVHMTSSVHIDGGSTHAFEGSPWGAEHVTTLEEPMPTVGNGRWSYDTVEPTGVVTENGDFLMRGSTVVGYTGEGGEITIPDGTRAIDAKAFAGNTTITGVTMPESLLMIGKSAFADCTALEQVSPALPDTLRLILPDAFSGCSSLKALDLPYATMVYDGAFAGTVFDKTNGAPYLLPDAFAPTRLYEKAFLDVSSDAWYADTVVRAYESGIIDGKSETRFDPDGSLTVAEAVKMAATIHAVGTGKTQDISPSTPWYKTYYDFLGRYSPFQAAQWDDAERQVTRAEFAYLMVCALPAAEMEQYGGGDRPFADLYEPDEGNGPLPYAHYVEELYRAGVISGYPDGLFHPDSTITRAEATVVLSRLMYPETRLPRTN